MIFIKIQTIYLKNIKSLDEKLRKKIGRKGKAKYMKYFNSNLVAQYIIDKTFEMKNSKDFLWTK